MRYPGTSFACMLFFVESWHDAAKMSVCTTLQSSLRCISAVSTEDLSITRETTTETHQQSDVGVA